MGFMGVLLNEYGMPVPHGTVDFYYLGEVTISIDPSLLPQTAGDVSYTLQEFDNLDCSQAAAAPPGSGLPSVPGSSSSTSQWQIPVDSNLDGKTLVFRAASSNVQNGLGILCTRVYYVPQTIMSCSGG
jgi:hypothetical protein